MVVRVVVSLVSLYRKIKVNVSIKLAVEARFVYTAISLPAMLVVMITPTGRATA